MSDAADDAPPSSESEGSVYYVARLNARILPLDRGEFFEDPLDELLQVRGLGAVGGGGTMQSASGEIQHCDIEIAVEDPSDDTARTIIAMLEHLGAPKGSALVREDHGPDDLIPFGVHEGLAVYLNGTDLPEQVYKECDINYVYEELVRLIDDEGRVLGHWSGPTETALYAYGPSFTEMNARIAAFLASYPLCQGCRVVQIA